MKDHFATYRPDEFRVVIPSCLWAFLKNSLIFLKMHFLKEK